PDRPGVPRPGRARRLRPTPRRHAVWRPAAARVHRPRARAVARGDPGRRADGQSRPRAHGQHHGPPEDDPGPARPHAGREPAPARDRAGLCDARRRLPPGPRRVRRPAGRALTGGGVDDLRRGAATIPPGRASLRRAAGFAPLVVLPWTAWDTGPAPARFARCGPWVVHVLRRMLAPDRRVVP